MDRWIDLGTRPGIVLSIGPALILDNPDRRRGLTAAPHPELGQHAVDVVLHGVDLDGQRFGDVLVGAALADESEHLMLTRGQHEWPLSKWGPVSHVRQPAYQHLRHPWRVQGLAAADPVDQIE